MSIIFIPKCIGKHLTSHTDFEIDLPPIATITTISALTCLHKCAYNNKCNVACVGKIAEHQFNCLFFNLVQTLKLKKHLRPRKGFIVYEFPKHQDENTVCRIILRFVISLADICSLFIPSFFISL